MKPEPAEIKFPCVWEYRLIVNGSDAAVTEAAVKSLDMAENAGFTVVSGEASGGGKYRSLRISCTVDSLERARTLAGKLGGLPGVKFMI
jgi:putative lipoic acid-binding regulatory protein